ncbi:MAG: exodeoxyribonuclease III [Actinomycetota bacterium]|nr:exodeoxyribonuclease III [Actinomycetota bacterium]
MRLATWNVNSVRARLPRLLEWLDAARPDVCCLQETKSTDAAFPTGAFGERGYDVAHLGTGRWNGVAVLSRLGLTGVRRGLAGDPRAAAPEARVLAATCGEVRVYSVYVPNGRALDSPEYPYKLAWLDALRADVAADLAAGLQVAVCGDVNVAPTDDDVWDAARFVGSTHVSAPERAALAAVAALGLRDVVREHQPAPGPFTFWDYRAGDFHNRRGMRIDLVLVSPPLADRVHTAYVDREARKGRGASDHAPVVVDLAP